MAQKTLEERIDRLEKMLADMAHADTLAPLDPEKKAAHDRVKVAKDEIKEEHKNNP